MDDKQSKSLLDDIQRLLDSKGYKVVTDSVDGKNQTRHVHMTLEKEGARYFAKGNKRREHYYDITNEALAQQLPEGDDFAFIRPVEILSINNNSDLLVYPFITETPICSESNNFSTLMVKSEDLDALFKATYSALDTLSKKDIYSFKDIGTGNPFHTANLVKWLVQSNPTDTDVIEALQLLAIKHHQQQSLVPSVSDTQPQNMFWDAGLKKVYFFDMENLRHAPRYYDFAKLASSLHIVCGQAPVSEGWVLYVVKRLQASDDPAEQIGQLHLMLLLTGVEYYCYFKRINDSKRTTDSIYFIRWALRDFVGLVNSGEGVR